MSSEILKSHKLLNGKELQLVRGLLGYTAWLVLPMTTTHRKNADGERWWKSGEATMRKAACLLMLVAGAGAGRLAVRQAD